MHSVESAAAALVGFLYQAITVGGLGAVYFVVPLIAIVIGLVRTFPRRDPLARRQLWIFLAGLPAVWILMGLLGGLYWCDWQHTTNHGGSPS